MFDNNAIFKNEKVACPEHSPHVQNGSVPKGNTEDCCSITDENTLPATYTHSQEEWASLENDLATLTGKALKSKFPSNYTAWTNLKSRSKKNKKIKGTKWSPDFESFPGFLKCVGPKPTHGDYSLDRIDPTAGYIPGNLRWASKTLQSQNRTNTKCLDVRGEPMTMKQFATKIGMSYDQLRMRFTRNWTVEDMLNEFEAPPKPEQPSKPQHSFKMPWPAGHEAQWEQEYIANRRKHPVGEQTTRCEYLLYKSKKMFSHFNQFGCNNYCDASTPAPPEFLAELYYWNDMVSASEVLRAQEKEFMLAEKFGVNEAKSIRPSQEELTFYQSLCSGAPSALTDEDVSDDECDY